MRKDMDRLLVQRPRYQGWNTERASYRRQRFNLQDLEVYEDEDGSKVVDLDDGGRHGAMSRGRGTKELNEYLAPLRRYLESQVNRPWDKVYSDIRENVRFDSAVQLHILQHIYGYVEKEVFEEGGRIFNTVATVWSDRLELRDGEMYVHPRTGLLLKYKRKKAGSQIPEATVIQVSNRVFYVKFDGLWFEVAYNVPVTRSQFRRGDYGHPKHLLTHFTFVNGKPERLNQHVTYTKRQLLKKVLRQHDLKNAA